MNGIVKIGLCSVLALGSVMGQAPTGTSVLRDRTIMTQVEALQLPWVGAGGSGRKVVDLAHGMDFGDVDGDGTVDLLIGPLEPQYPHPRLYLNDGSGRFVNVSATHMPSLHYAFGPRVFLVDVDGDSDLDMLGANYQPGGRNPLLLYVNDGTGHFTDESHLRMAPPFNWIEHWTAGIGDVDGDGDIDMVTSGGYNRYTLFLNDGRGHFSFGLNRIPQISLDRTSYNPIQLVDADRDGDLDLFAAGDYGLGMVYYQNDGTGTFTDVSTSHLDPVIHAVGILAVAVADFDGDSDPDIIASTNPRWPSYYVLLNDGLGMFSFGGTQRMLANAGYGGTGWSMQPLDIDADGDLDVLSTRPPSSWELGGNHFVYLNDGQANFTYDAERRFFGDDPVAGMVDVITADLDGDGDPEVIEQSFGSFSQLPRHLPYYTNTYRQLLAAAPAQRGRDWLLEIHGPAGSQALLFFSPSRAARPLPIPGVGNLGLDPGSTIPWSPAFTTAADRRVRIPIAIPNLPQLSNASIYAQALLLEPNSGLRLTNLWVERAIR